MEDRTNSSTEISLILLIISSVFLFLNFAIGDTILLNVLVLFISFIAGVASLFTSIIELGKQGRKQSLLIVLVCSIAILILLFCLVFLDGIPMGYGP